ncbi:transmembrane protein 248 isoform X2 [Sphaeramia orbicularis]|nr:transmembrane protein 248-like isoform X2 [Sphaeramia orbicularis]
MMGFWQPLTNLRGCISQNPPWVTFFLCLLALAVSFIGLACYSYSHTLPNPDSVKDWNHLLSSLSQYQLCTKANESSPELVYPVPSALEQDVNREASPNSTETPSSVAQLHLKVPLTVTTNTDSSSLKDLCLHTSLKASQLNLGDNEILNVTVKFLSENDSHACLTISAPAHLLPMSLLPPVCPASVKNISAIHVDAGEQLTSASHTCYSLHSKNDPTLRVMLTKEDQRVAVQHLIEVSVFLLGVCLIICLVGSLTTSLTRRYQWNGLDLQNEPLIDP